MRIIHLLALSLVAAFALTIGQAHAADKPNIIYILADDLGYGDVQCLNPEGKIPTPHMDRIAREGMIFTDAHSSSSVCTPTRYGVLTGRYNWRTHLQRGVLGGYSLPLIDSDRMTVAELLQRNGYATACIGKWHLGMKWPLKGGGFADDSGNFGRGYAKAMDVDYTAPIQDGPNDRGFDYYFGISASLDMPPYLFIRNRKATEVPTRTASLWGRREGAVGESFRLVDVLPRLTEEAVGFIDKHADDAKQGKPFFIYMPLNSPHTPIVPTEKWAGRSKINDYADFVMQSDWTVGQILEALDRNGLAENTLVIFTSDNGCSPQANFGQLAKHGHDPSQILRGHKADIYEGGHRMPFLVRWPAKVKAGSQRDQTICLTDLMATCADIIDAKLPDDAGVDSVSFLPAMVSDTNEPLRDATVHHSINGSFAIRQGKWKLNLCPGSGGWSAPRPGKATKGMYPVQLFDLSKDISEKHNVAEDHPDVVRRLTALLQQQVDQGRSTPGPKQENDAAIDIFKGNKPPALQ